MSLRPFGRRIVPALLALGLLAPANRGTEIRAHAADNPIVFENQQAGSTAWHLAGPAVNDATGQIKGYASATSVNQNDSITLYVSVKPPQNYTIDIYRVGWYGGAGARLRLHAGPLQGLPQQPCLPDPTTGLIACAWVPSYTLAIPSDWTSGVYLGLLTNAQGFQDYLIFVVRDGRPAAFLFEQAVATYQAYNNYPDDGMTGKSLYSFNSYGPNTVSGETRAVKVSFDRPYAWTGAGRFFFWEIEFVRWLERSGYDVTYATDIDLHENGAALRNSKAVLFGGQEEYWSKEMFDAAEAARDAGVSLGFFNADALGRQVRFEASGAGVPDRVVVCYKSAAIDPVSGPTTTVNFREAPVNRPEQTLIGVQWTGEVDWSSNVDYVVMNSSHWVYAGTGFKDGDVVPGLVGYEMDRYFTNYPGPNTSNQTLLSQSPFTDQMGISKWANSSIYQAPSGAWVFAAGTFSWSWGLDNYDHNRADPRIQQTTANVLNAFLYGAPIVHDLKLTAPSTVTAGEAFTVTVSAENAQGNPVTEYGGTVHFSTSDPSPGIALPPDSNLTNGQGAFSVTLRRAGSQTLTVSDAASALSTTSTLLVQTGVANHLALAGAAAQTATAGASFSFTVTAKDAFGNIDPTYAGAVHFQSSDRSAGVVLPPDSALVNGQGTFDATLDRAGSQTITATDTANPGVAGTLSVAVTAASATWVALATTAAPTAGASFSFTVTALDQFGNTDPSYGGTVHFASTDTSPGVVLPSDSALRNGRGSFSATLDRAGSQGITATDVAQAAISGTLTVQVKAAPAATVILTAPSAVLANQAFTIGVTLTDRFGNVATGYRGTVHFTTTDLLAQTLGAMPPDYAFVSGDAGRHSFTATLVTLGSATITVADTADASLSATSPPIAVNLL